MPDPISLQVFEALEKTQQSIISGDRKGIIKISRYNIDDIPNPREYDLPDYNIAKSTFEVAIEITEDQSEEGVEFGEEVLDFLKIAYIHKEPTAEEDFSFKLTPVRGKSNAFFIKEYVIDDDTGEPVYLGDITVFEFADGFKRRDLINIRNAVAEQDVV